jgi:hypothetical protein
VNSRQRDFLILHIDGPVRINRQDAVRDNLMGSCVRERWLSLGAQTGVCRMIRPEFSHLTHDGRAALCKALAALADDLVRERDARLDRDFGDALERDLAPGVLEPAE